jgi:hypothetical protein
MRSEFWNNLHPITTHIWLQQNDLSIFIMDWQFASAHIFIPLFDEDMGGILTNNVYLKTKTVSIKSG